MRIAESITLPPELERARAAGTLVVFAGAGVSMGEPANLPGFRDLAQRIAEPVVMLSDRRDFDRYLGEAERAGIRVQDRARSLLANGGSHTPLHEYLVGIFGSAERVRLITTNFDPHFTSAAHRVYPGVSIPHYIGPALPPGSRFSGIAHLHGALANTQDRLVLTAADFAEAYMAEGWAARFLVRAFAERTVLFVGYSVSDPIIQYLLQALPPTGRWFGMWHDGETPSREHSITPVTFSTGADGDRFGDLINGLRVWRWYATAPPSDHERRLQTIITAGPPTSALDADYIRARLATDAGRTVFLSSAKDAAWFAWAVGEGILDSLLRPESDWNTTALWSRWCLFNFCAGDNPDLLRFLRTRSLSLHPAFLAELRRHLCSMDTLPPTPVLRQLVALTVNDPATDQSVRHDWEWLIEKLVRSGHKLEAFTVLRAATRIRLAPIEHVYASFDDDDARELGSLSIRVRTYVAPADLERALQRCGEDLAASDAEALLLLGEQRIYEAYELLDLARGSSSDIDWLSYGRTAIAASNQDTHAHSADVLILIVRTALDYWERSAPHRLQTFAERHIGNRRNTLTRLALYALANCSDYPADAVLTLLLEHRTAQKVWLRPELYLVLAAHYSRASEEQRIAFIEALRDNATWGDEFDEHDAHSRFGLSRKLLRDAPDSAATISFAREEEALHPEWGEADQDGYLSRVSFGWGGADAPSPIESPEMLGWDPPQAQLRLRELLEHGRQNGQWHSILGAVQQAVKEAPEWGARLAGLTVGGNEKDEHIAEAALWALRDAHPENGAQIELLNCVSDTQLSERILSALSMTLENWARIIPKGQASALLDAFDSAADMLFAESHSIEPGIEGRGWTEASINHPAGRAAQIWWSVANARDWVGDDFVLSMDDAERERWIRVVTDETASGTHARPILGMATGRLSVGDAPWSNAEVFPYFAPARGAARSAQLWDGRLMQSQWSWATVEALRPYCEPLFAVSGSLIPERSRQLGDWVAFLVANLEKSGLTLQLLQLFIRSATEEARVAFADALPRHLERLGPDGRHQLWNELLSHYWADRRTNMPAPLSNSEVREMVGWVVALSEVSEQVLHALRATECESVEQADHLIWQWRDDNTWLTAHPTEAAGIVAFLAETKSVDPWMAEEAVAVLEKAFECGAAKGVLLEALEALVALGCRAAPALVEKVRSAA